MESLPKQLCKLLKNQTGFSLAEVMVAAGVTGTLALGTMQLANLHTQSQMTDELLTVQQTVQTVLKNSKACSASFGGQNIFAFRPYDGSIATSVEVLELKKSDGSTLIKRSPSYLNITPANEDLVDRSDNYVVFGNIVMVKSMYITNVRAIGGKTKAAATALKRTGVAELEIVFAIKNPRMPAGSKIKEVTKHILFPIKFSQTGQIEDCTSPEDIGVQETEAEMCTALGGSLDAGNRCTNAGDVLNTETKLAACLQLGGSFYAPKKSCTPPWAGCNCAGASNMITGFRSVDPGRGKPICKIGAPTGCLIP